LEHDQAHDREMTDVPVWDIWIRLFHWGLLAAVAASFFTDQIADMDSHYIAGLVVLGLVVFRLLWGVVGSPTARFGRFIRGPGAALSYLRYAAGRRPSFSFGHNPAGALMVVALLLALLVQAVSGLFNTDDIIFEGPLHDNAGSAVTDLMGDLHEVFGNLILTLVGLHVLVVLLYRLVKGENLLRAMILGRARLPRQVGKAAETSGATHFASPLRGLACALLAAAVPLAIHWLN
jgi:cytochrome b